MNASDFIKAAKYLGLSDLSFYQQWCLGREEFSSKEVRAYIKDMVFPKRSSFSERTLEMHLFVFLLNEKRCGEYNGRRTGSKMV